MTVELQVRSKTVCFGGEMGFYRHASSTCNGDMNFAVYLPPIARSQPVPVLYFLSGLTCSDENFMTKAGAQRMASELGLLLVAPDTSPRGQQVADDPDSWSLGQGAGFYIDAIEEPWRSHYQMYSYITQELPALIQSHFPVMMDVVASDASSQNPPSTQARQSIMGHSMGGHGALTIALKNPTLYCSVSAFSPICAPSQTSWGETIFHHYLGDDRAKWAESDATELVQRSPLPYPILIDQGLEDCFLDTELRLDLFEAACLQSGQALKVERRSGYDHGYYFISSFIENHLRFHARSLMKSQQ